MAQQQLSVRSARARELAYQISRRERRTIAQVVEQALEQYAGNHVEIRQSAEDFYAGLRALPGDEIDFDAILDENRRPHDGPKL